MPSSVVQLTGLWDDGGDRRALGVPGGSHRAVRIIRGQRTVFEVTVLTPAGQRVDMNGGIAILSAKATTADEETLFQSVGWVRTELGEGRVDFLVEGEATRYLEPGIRVYDIWLALPTQESMSIVDTSPLHVASAVTPAVVTTPEVEVASGGLTVQSGGLTVVI